MNPEDEVAGIFGDFDDDNDDDVADILSQGDYDGEHDAPGGERGDEPSSKRQRSGSLCESCSRGEGRAGDRSGLVELGRTVRACTES